MSYLSSRAEILRSMYIDTGIRVAIIGSPEEFNRWIDTGVPEDTDYLGGPGDIPDDGVYGRILIWDEEDLDFDPASLLGHLDGEGEIWSVVPVMDESRNAILGKYDPLRELGHAPIPLTISLEIYPVHISKRSARDQPKSLNLD
ncbi:MAG: hypothetical protein ACMUIG_04430 [Thermoplasmatota archaeon]